MAENDRAHGDGDVNLRNPVAKVAATNKTCANFVIRVMVNRIGINRIGDCNRTAIMNVSLTPELERFVASEVETGLYQTASEVIRAGLCRLKQEKERLPAGPRTAEELEIALLDSIQRLDRGAGVDGEAVFRRLRKRIKGHHARG